MSRFALALVVAVVLSVANTASAALSPTRLRWDGWDRPLGFIQFEPRLSWALVSRARGGKQTAFQVLVASDPTRLAPGRADVWDSGKVASAESINVRYAGPTPKARQRAFWTVRVWDNQDQPSAFAPATWWEMGLYDEEWEGKWIGRPRRQGEPTDTRDRSVICLRKAFSLPRGVQRARVYASAFGTYQLSVNGQRVGDGVLAPGYTDYEKRVLFQAHDITRLLRSGDNVLGAIVAGGWCTAGLGGRTGACGFEPPRLMVQLEVTLADGTLRVIPSDESWRAHAGPILSAHLTEGEVYDARKEMPGWDAPGFDDGGWAAVQAYDKEKERDLVADPGARIEVTSDPARVRMTEPRPGVYLFDLGHRLVGWARLKVRAPAGTTIIMRYVDEAAGAGAADRYTASGRGLESWEPRFSVHTFRSVEVTGLPARPRPGTITARAVHSAMPVTGRLATSSPQLDALVARIDRAQQNSFLSVPHRGSMIQARAVAMTGCLFRDVQAFYRKWIDDIRDAQHRNGAYSDTAPAVDGHEGGPAGAAGVTVPWALHRCYADRTALDAHMVSMGRWLDLVRERNPDLVWKRDLGAFAGDPGETGTSTVPALIATAELIHAADAVAQIARSGGPDLASYVDKYDTLARGARAAFARQWASADGKLPGDTQGVYALAIALGALDAEARGRAGRHLVAAIERQGKRTTTGVLGSAHLLPALSSIGRDDLAHELLAQGDLSAAVGEWMYDAIGGIALDPVAPAGKHVFIRPRPAGGVTFARASYESLYGTIRTDWRREAKMFRLKVTIPANASATLTLPLAGKVSEGGRPVDRAAGVKVVDARGGVTIIDVESGTYDFLVVAP